MIPQLTLQLMQLCLPVLCTVMYVQDPSRSPSAQLHHRLQRQTLLLSRRVIVCIAIASDGVSPRGIRSCEILIDGFRSVAERVEGAELSASTARYGKFLPLSAFLQAFWKWP